MPRGRLLKGIPDTQNHAFVIRLAADHEADRQALRREAAWHRETTHAQNIAHAGVAGMPWIPHSVVIEGRIDL